MDIFVGVNELHIVEFARVVVFEVTCQYQTSLAMLEIETATSSEHSTTTTQPPLLRQHVTIDNKVHSMHPP